MQPDKNSEMLEQATHLFKSRMVRVALSHLTGMDIRTAVALELSGAVERDHEVKLESNVIEVVGDQSHALRNKTSPGPILFYRNTEQDEHQYALNMTEVLLSDHCASRIGAVRHFRHLASLPLTITSKSIRLLEQLENEILSSDLTVWQTAALKLYDAIREDFLCILAAVRQSIEERYEDGVKQYFPQLLRPTMNSLGALEVEILKAGQQPDAGERLIQQLVYNSESFEFACDWYLEEVGFLPLEGPSSFSALVNLWEATRGSLPNAWATIWHWVEESRSSLPTYHACFYFLGAISSIPQGQERFLWTQLLKICDAQSESEPNNNIASEWRVRTELARHYLQFLELRLPGVVGDDFARVALWLTEKVVTLIGRDPSTIERFRNIAIIPEAFSSEFAWRVANPSGTQAPLPLAMHGLVPIWALSLLPKMTRSTLRALKGGIPEETRESFEKVITSLFFRGFPVIPQPKSPQIVYSFEGPAESVIDSWIEEYGESERMKFVKTINALHLKLFDPAEFSDVFNTLRDKESEADQLFIANCAGVLAKQGILPLEPVWACLTDTEWRKNVFGKAPETVLEILFIAFAASLNRGGKLWMTEIPHYYAMACEDSLDDRDRSDLFFGWMLLACVHTYSVSAIERLLRGKRAGDLVEYVAKWRGVYMDHAKNNAPWIAARSRAILAALNVAS